MKLYAQFFIAVCLMPLMAHAWPSKPIHLVVPFNAGGTIDTVARNLGQKLSINLKQPVIVENKPGAGSLIAAEQVAKALPDGHTVLITTNGLAIASNLYKKVPFDPKKDLLPISELMSTYMTLAVGSKVPVNSFKEFVMLAKSKPGELNYGSTGIGSAPHLVMETLKASAKINLIHIPFSGDAPMNQALLSGSIDAVITPISGVYENMRNGKLKILAITDNKRSELVPNVPTIDENGLPGFEYLGWVGIFAPAATDSETLLRIQVEFSKILNTQEMKEKMSFWGYEGVGSTSETFKAKYLDDLSKYSRVIKEINVSLD
jgi:tripartite-type tricarboxylate transporter receptor subunit TctC